MIPIFLKPDEGRPCLVVGGGRIARRKIQWLLECGARVVGLSPRFESEIEALAGRQPEKVTLWREAYPPSAPAEFLAPYQLVIAATDDPKVNEAVAGDARRVGVPVNAADQPALCTFYVPAVVQRGDLQIAISTSGAAPALAGRIRGELEERYPAWLAIYTQALGIVRREYLDRVGDENRRQALMHHLTSRMAAEALKGLDLDQSVKQLHQWAEAWLSGPEKKDDKKT